MKNYTQCLLHRSCTWQRLSHPYMGIVYKATVQYEDEEQNYIGMTENTFKTRYTLHKASFNHSTKRKQTELSNLIWTLKDNGTEYKLTWSIINRARPYQPGKRTCNLCRSEKFHILTGSHLINRKTELLNKCPRRRKYITCNFLLDTTLIRHLTPNQLFYAC